MAPSGFARAEFAILGPILGVSLIFANVTSFFFILSRQHDILTHQTYRIQVLSTRTALYLPAYAFLFYIALCAPILYNAVQPLLCLVEGYSFCCFFALLVSNLGGPKSCVEKIYELDHTPLCRCMFRISVELASEEENRQKTAANFYSTVLWALFHFLVTRFFVLVIEAAFNYAGLLIAATVFDIISTLMVIYAFICIIAFYHHLHEVSQNIRGVKKILLLKLSVLMIAFGRLLEQAASGNSAFRVNPNSHPINDAQILYCFIILLLLTLVSIFSYAAFRVKMDPPEVPVLLGWEEPGSREAHNPLSSSARLRDRGGSEGQRELELDSLPGNGDDDSFNREMAAEERSKTQIRSSTTRLDSEIRRSWGAGGGGVEAGLGRSSERKSASGAWGQSIGVGLGVEVAYGPGPRAGSTAVNGTEAGAGADFGTGRASSFAVFDMNANSPPLRPSGSFRRSTDRHSNVIANTPKTDPASPKALVPPAPSGDDDLLKVDLMVFVRDVFAFSDLFTPVRAPQVVVPRPRSRGVQGEGAGAARRGLVPLSERGTSLRTSLVDAGL